MRCNPATNPQIKMILHELECAKERTDSSDFLVGFPLENTIWYSCKLEYNELESLFLFWDGNAWGEDVSIPPRRLDEGVLAFMQIANESSQPNNVHLNQIKDWLNKYEESEIQNTESFLILGGLDEKSPLLILDGNHRASAALWWAIKNGDRSKLPENAWIGLSQKMVCYQYYWRIPQVQKR